MKLTDNRGLLCAVVDSVGRKLRVSTNAEGRIEEVCLLEDNGTHQLIAYNYI